MRIYNYNGDVGSGDEQHFELILEYLESIRVMYRTLEGSHSQQGLLENLETAHLVRQVVVLPLVGEYLVNDF